MTQPDTLALSRRALRVLIKLNLIFGVLILALLLWSLLAPEFVMRALGAMPVGRIAPVTGMRMIMVVGIFAVPFTHIVLTGLAAIVETVGHGTPFIPKNADRLRTMAWAILALELMHIVVVLIARSVASSGVPIDIKFSFSITRWLTVLLLFVLARVFEEGARMQHELEGTV
jgi:hypothetical protein